jgi:acetyltransferase-like isoleucine patch superfamily enzyme
MNLTREEIEKIGFKSVGENVIINRDIQFYSPGKISIGNNVRIDGYCVISPSGGLEIGDYVHIACGSSIIGAAPIVMKAFSGISSRVAIYSSNEDYSGAALTNPTVPEKYRKASHAPVTLHEHVIVGSGSIIMPGVELGVGSAVGALSFVNRSVEEFTIVSGNPARKITNRKRDTIRLEEELRKASS